MSWYTKEDVLDDLAQVMGGRVKDLDEQFILVGEQPPPACRSGEEDDDKLLLRLNGALGDKSAEDECKGPDLAGITEMLRMVDKYQSPDSGENSKSSFHDNDTTVISICKLNPDVPEFIPSENVKDGKTEDDESDVVNCSDNTELSMSNSKEKEVEKVDLVKRKEISKKLKNKISSPSKTDCFKIKRERNLAIATLLKLHSDDTVLTAIEENTSPKLFTPDYFEKACTLESATDRASQSSQKKSPSSRSSLTKKSIENVIEDTKLDTNLNQEVEESVIKVNNWLNKDEKPKPMRPPLFLGPVTFKKKQKAKPQTPTSDTSDKTLNQTVSSQFVPSDYANKLTQSYMERSKAKEDQTLDIWSKLEKHLKAKDEEIISRRKRERESTQTISKESISVDELRS